MGARLNWLAVKDADKAALLNELGLTESGIASDELRAPLACAEFPDGWLVLVSSEMALDLDEALPIASKDGLALGCEAEEHVMFSRLRAFHARAPVWNLTHDPHVDPDDIIVEGEPPPPFEELRAAMAAMQAAHSDEAVDYMFDLPVRLGQQLCGYAYDEPRPVVWSILERGGRRRSTHASQSLSDAFSSEILPLLAPSGWSLGAMDPDYSGRAWDVTRLVDKRRQLISFIWKQNGPHLEFETTFVVFDGSEWSDKLLLKGKPRPTRQPSGGSGGSLWRRVVGAFAGQASAEPRPPDPLAQLVSRVRDDLTAIDAFLTSGAEDPRISIEHRPAYY